MNQDLDQIYQTYSRRVYLYLLSLSHDPALSEDLMQETFLKAAKSIDKFKGNSSLSSWLCAIARNLFNDAMRHQKKTVQLDQELFSMDPEQRDLRVFSCLHDLEEPYREIIYLRVFCSMSYREIGEILGKTETWSRVMFYRGKEKLRELWMKKERDLQ
ncbi:RNA polymerase sigma factor [Allobaculum mucilyticum]|uniref:RNA polymerase sigma factor n=1 Tax=Allobaculum mucilyticum TaxID=2834459 RepID=UPI001E477131|nr:sigma-70 family RNA polymerase sigma factor [Allobaculum mucilyticum]UNT97334.1 sigma-70 family RNA polymerase sigma factor [Allobaculum mucilyticum]